MKLITILFLLVTSFAFSQNLDELYIIVPESRHIIKTIAKDKTGSVEVYTFSIVNENPEKFIYKIDDAQRLILQRLIAGKSFPTFRITYSNFNGENSEFRLERNDINILDLSDLPKLTDAENFFSTITKFKTIYILEERSKRWFAKKVQFERLASL
ncbi:MAG: hypothetical protein IR153_02740 [Flavobacterium sp.]|nr:hypothetical protein [Flavobacterium sp.]